MPVPSVPFKVRALYENHLEQEDDLDFKPQQQITVSEVCDEEWYYGFYEDSRTGQRKQGMFPSNLVTVDSIEQTSPHVQARDAHIPIVSERPVQDDDDWSDSGDEQPSTGAPVKEFSGLNLKQTNVGATPSATHREAAVVSPTLTSDPEPAQLVTKDGTQDIPKTVTDELHEPTSVGEPEPTHKYEPHSAEPSAHRPRTKSDSKSVKPSPPKIDPIRADADSVPTAENSDESLTAKFKERMARFNQPQAEESTPGKPKPKPKTPGKLAGFAPFNEQPEHREPKPRQESEDAPRISIKERLAAMRKQEEEMRNREEEEHRHRAEAEEARKQRDEARRLKQQQKREEEARLEAQRLEAAAQAPQDPEEETIVEKAEEAEERAVGVETKEAELSEPDEEEEARKVALRERMARIAGAGGPAGGVQLGMLFGGPRQGGQRRKDLSAMSNEEREAYLASIGYEENQPVSVIGIPGAGVPDEETMRKLRPATEEAQEGEVPNPDEESTLVGHEHAPDVPHRHSSKDITPGSPKVPFGASEEPFYKNEGTPIVPPEELRKRASLDRAGSQRFQDDINATDLGMATEEKSSGEDEDDNIYSDAATSPGDSRRLATPRQTTLESDLRRDAEIPLPPQVPRESDTEAYDADVEEDARSISKVPRTPEHVSDDLSRRPTAEFGVSKEPKVPNALGISEQVQSAPEQSIQRAPIPSMTSPTLEHEPVESPGYRTLDPNAGMDIQPNDTEKTSNPPLPPPHISTSSQPHSIPPIPNIGHKEAADVPGSPISAHRSAPPIPDTIHRSSDSRPPIPHRESEDVHVPVSRAPPVPLSPKSAPRAAPPVPGHAPHLPSVSRDNSLNRAVSPPIPGSPIRKAPPVPIATPGSPPQGPASGTSPPKTRDLGATAIHTSAHEPPAVPKSPPPVPSAVKAAPPPIPGRSHPQPPAMPKSPPPLPGGLARSASVKAVPPAVPPAAPAAPAPQPPPHTAPSASSARTGPALTKAPPPVPHMQNPTSPGSPKQGSGFPSTPQTTSKRAPVVPAPSTPVDKIVRRTTTRSSVGGGDPRIDLALESLWFTRPNAIPPTVDTKNVAVEVERSQFNKRGREVVTHDVYFLYPDLSQIQVNIYYETSHPEGATGSQNYIPPPKLDENKLVQYSSTIGANIVGAVTGKSIQPTFDFVAATVSQVKGALHPINGSFGIVIYENFSNSSVHQIESIRPGDIAVLKDAAFQGHKGPLQKYHKNIDNGVYVVQSWDGNKKKLHVFDNKKESFKLSDLHSGVVRIFRVIDRSYVGW